MNNFQFSTDQTFQIVDGLDKCGVDYIEVGHGIGLGASREGHGTALEKDIDYMSAAKSASKNSKWGVFAIPGICSKEDLELCAKIEVDFVRIGIDIENLSNGIEFIKISKSLGICTFVNFMKSYTRSPVEFEIAARKAIEIGADFVMS